MGRRTFRYDAETDSMVEVGYSDYAPTGHLIVPDLPAYESPIDGRVIDGRAARREDLKRSGCREYDPGERRIMQERRAAEDAALTKAVDRTVEKWFYEGNSRRRELMVQALRAGIGPQIVRK